MSGAGLYMMRSNCPDILVWFTVAHKGPTPEEIAEQVRLMQLESYMRKQQYDYEQMLIEKQTEELMKCTSSSQVIPTATSSPSDLMSPEKPQKSILHDLTANIRASITSLLK